MLSTTSEDLESWLSNLTLLEHHKSFVGPRFLKPYHLATLAIKLKIMGANDVKLPDKIASYAHTMKLWDVLDSQGPEAISFRHPAGRYHPLEALKNVNLIDHTAASLLQLLSTVCNDNETLNAVDTMLKELIDNCYSHSSVSDGQYGLICAQVWPGGNKAQITITDNGIGIRNSLIENLEYREMLKSMNSCELATEYGVTGKPGMGHAGYGLAVARGLIEQNNGTLFVRSGNECFHLHEGNRESFYTDNHFDGTLLIIEWNLDKQMDISDVYQGWPQIEGMDDDDFDF